MITPHGLIEWAITSAHTLLQRDWPAHTGAENRRLHDIRQGMVLRRKRLGEKGPSPTLLAPMVITRPSACRTIRHLHNGAFAVLLLEERVLELPTDRLVSLGLTPREAEVLRWLVQGKSSVEIATILSLRPVSKHVERVYLRLGVEHRHAAVAGVHDELIRTAPGRYPRRLPTGPRH